MSMCSLVKPTDTIGLEELHAALLRVFPNGDLPRYNVFGGRISFEMVRYSYIRKLYSLINSMHLFDDNCGNRPYTDFTVKPSLVSIDLVNIQSYKDCHKSTRFFVNAFHPNEGYIFPMLMMEDGINVVTFSIHALLKYYKYNEEGKEVKHKNDLVIQFGVPVFSSKVNHQVLLNLALPKSVDMTEYNAEKYKEVVDDIKTSLSSAFKKIIAEQKLVNPRAITDDNRHLLGSIEYMIADMYLMAKESDNLYVNKTKNNCHVQSVNIQNTSCVNAPVYQKHALSSFLATVDKNIPSEYCGILDVAVNMCDTITTYGHKGNCPAESQWNVIVMWTVQQYILYRDANIIRSTPQISGTPDMTETTLPMELKHKLVFKIWDGEDIHPDIKDNVRDQFIRDLALGAISKTLKAYNKDRSDKVHFVFREPSTNLIHLLEYKITGSGTCECVWDIKAIIAYPTGLTQDEINKEVEKAWMYVKSQLEGNSFQDGGMFFEDVTCVTSGVILHDLEALKNVTENHE